MTSEEVTRRVLAALSLAGVEHMVVGSFSSNLYGVTRSTKDLDIVVSWGDRSIHDVMAKLGPEFRLDPQMSFEMVTSTVRHIIEVADSRFVVELFQLSDDEHDLERFRRRKSLPLADQMTAVATPEDVIITKLNWYSRQGRQRDYDDAANVIAVQGSSLDLAYIWSWCDRHGTREVFEQIRASVPNLD